MNNSIFMKVTEAVEHLTRGANILGALDTFEILKVSQWTILHHEFRLQLFFEIYDFNNVRLSNS